MSDNVLFSSKRQDWRTPSWFLDLVRLVAANGRIALDPFAHPLGKVHADAEYLLSRGEDGLALSWLCRGLAFVNPPYGRAMNRRCAEKIAREGAGGTEIIALLPARPDARWFQPLWETAQVICFPRGRIKFVGASSGATFPSAVVYYGSRCRRFVEVFATIGEVVLPGTADVGLRQRELDEAELQQYMVDRIIDDFAPADAVRWHPGETEPPPVREDSRPDLSTGGV